MSQLETRYVYGFSCDARDCEATHEGEERDYFNNGYWEEASALGWRSFNSRTTRYYCPEHGPSKSFLAKMARDSEMHTRYYGRRSETTGDSE